MSKIGWVFVVTFLLLLLIGFAKKGIYSPQLGMNAIVVGDTGVSIILIRPREGVMTWVKLPDDLDIKIANSEATYPLLSIWKYGVSEKHPFAIVEKSLSSTLSVLLPRTIKVKGLPTPDNLLGSLHKIGLVTDLSLRDRIYLRRDLAASVNSKKYLEVEIPDSALNAKVDPDGKEFVEVNSILNLWTKNKFVFDVLLGENVNVVINNLSNEKGAGLQLSRKLESAGLRVVELASDSEKNREGKGCVYKINKEHFYTDFLLTNYAGCKKLIEKGNTPSELVEIWLL